MKVTKFSLFLGDLSLFCTEKDIENVFSHFGDIVEIRIKRSKETSKPLSYGFVDFASASSAVSAMNTLNGFILNGRPLRISWAVNRKGKSDPSGNQVETNKLISIHVNFQTLSKFKVVNEEFFRLVFSLYGTVKDATIKQSVFDDNGNQKGYGFVSFNNDMEGISAAVRASSEMVNKTIDGVVFKSEISKSMQKYLSSVLNKPSPTGVTASTSPYLSSSFGDTNSPLQQQKIKSFSPTPDQPYSRPQELNLNQSFRSSFSSNEPLSRVGSSDIFDFPNTESKLGRPPMPPASPSMNFNMNNNNNTLNKGFHFENNRTSGSFKNHNSIPGIDLPPLSRQSRNSSFSSLDEIIHLPLERNVSASFSSAGSVSDINRVYSIDSDFSFNSETSAPPGLLPHTHMNATSNTNSDPALLKLLGEHYSRNLDNSLENSSPSDDFHSLMLNSLGKASSSSQLNRNAQLVDMNSINTHAMSSLNSFQKNSEASPYQLF